MNTQSQFTSRSVSDLVYLYVLLVISLGFNVFLGWNIHVLRNPSAPSAVTGVVLKPFIATDENGMAHLLAFSGSQKPTVLYVMNPNCHWCARNLANIKSVVNQTVSHFSFVGISIPDTDLTHYTKENDLPFPVYTIASYDVVQDLPLGVTPQTIVIGMDGKVQRNWIGAFIGKNADEVSEYFGIKLPGLLPEAVTAAGR